MISVDLVLNWWNNSENIAVKFLRDYVTEPIGEFLQYLGDSYEEAEGTNDPLTNVATKVYNTFFKVVGDIGVINTEMDNRKCNSSIYWGSVCNSWGMELARHKCR